MRTRPTTTTLTTLLASLLLAALFLAPAAGAGPAAPASAPAAPTAAYLDNTGRDDIWTGGVRMIPITTPSGTFNVWTKRVGNNPQVKVLLLHGGPGATHEYFEAVDSWFPAAGIEYYYYDQLGSWYSDKPTDEALWDLQRFAEEVEQIRLALGLDRDNFYLLGHSAGGAIAIEYALKYGEHLKGMVVSNMMSNLPAYNAYAHDALEPTMDPAALAEIKEFEAKGDVGNPRYMELMIPSFYEQHLLRRPFAEWPEPVARSFGHLNPNVYVLMQGPSELGCSGRMATWDRSGDLGRITVPTLVVGARYDTMDPAHMEKMAGQLPHGQYLYCPEGSHFALYDDQATWMKGVIGFLTTPR